MSRSIPTPILYEAFETLYSLALEVRDAGRFIPETISDPFHIAELSEDHYGICRLKSGENLVIDTTPASYFRFSSSAQLTLKLVVEPIETISNIMSIERDIGQMGVTGCAMAFDQSKRPAHIKTVFVLGYAELEYMGWLLSNAVVN